MPGLERSTRQEVRGDRSGQREKCKPQQSAQDYGAICRDDGNTDKSQTRSDKPGLGSRVHARVEVGKPQHAEAGEQAEEPARNDGDGAEPTEDFPIISCSPSLRRA